MASLEIKNVNKSFGNINILRDINLEIGDGEFLVLVGPSGCGKSTLLSIIAGLEPLTTGAICIDDRSIEHLEPKERDIAMVFQSYALYPSMTVGKNMAFPLKMRGQSAQEQDAKVKQVSDLLQIGHLLDRKPQQLSGGQRQRVAMGRALVRDPKVFLFDEPLSNLDAKLRVDMRTEIKRLHQRVKKTTVYVTHDQVEAMTMATRIAVMKDGRVQQFGTPAEIYDRPNNTFVATFMGSPSMNLVPAVIADMEHIQIEGTTTLVPIPQHARNSKVKPNVGQKVLLGLRPEWFTKADYATNGGVLVDVTVEVLEPTGPDIYAAIRIGSHEVMARLPATTSLSAGVKARFEIDINKASVFNAETGNAFN